MTTMISVPMFQYSDDKPWIEWKMKNSVLLAEIKTDGRYAYDKETERLDISDIGNPITTYPIHRGQYHAVLNRFKMASNRSGSFSAWKT